MAFISSLSYHLPENIITNEQLKKQFGDIELVAKTMGVTSRHYASTNETASDLAVIAAEKLFSENQTNPKDIGFLIFCTQSPDYFMPSTACVLQNRLGLPTTAGALCIDLGCSGFVYGLAIANSIVESNLAKNVLLLTGDTISKYMHADDKNRLLFGDASSATLISNQGIAKIGEFDLGTDGSGYDNIIVRNGANRHREKTGESYIDKNGNKHYDDCFFMDGEAVFNFTIDRLPQLIDSCLVKNKMNKDDIDYFVFHQANKYMLNTIRKVNKLSKDSFYIDLSDTGNTTSSTIPIGLTKCIKEGIVHHDMNVMIAGFGVGLSWAATTLRF